MLQEQLDLLVQPAVMVLAAGADHQLQIPSHLQHDRDQVAHPVKQVVLEVLVELEAAHS